MEIFIFLFTFADIDAVSSKLLPSFGQIFFQPKEIVSKFNENRHCQTPTLWLKFFSNDFALPSNTFPSYKLFNVIITLPTLTVTLSFSLLLHQYKMQGYSVPEWLQTRRSKLFHLMAPLWKFEIPGSSYFSLYFLKFPQIKKISATPEQKKIFLLTSINTVSER